MNQQSFRQIDNNAGLVTDIPSNLVVWSNLNNVRFKPGCIYKTTGKELLTTVPGGSAIRGMFTFVDNSNIIRTIVCCDNNVYAYQNDFGNYLDITPSPAPKSDGSSIWQFTLIGGCPVVSDGATAVWVWLNFGSVLTKLSGAPIPKCITTSYARLMMGNIIDGGYNYPARLKWSKPFNPTKFTVNKNETAGYSDLVNMGEGIDTSERIKSIYGNGEQTYIFSDRTAWLATLYRSPYYYQLRIIPDSSGIMSSRARAMVKGVLYIIGNDDFYAVTSQGYKSLGMNIKGSVFPNINKAASHMAFNFYQPSTREVFFCLPMLDNANNASALVNTAYIYNLELNNWSKCDVDYLCHSYGWNTNQINWDNAAGSWDNQSDSWDVITNNGILPYSVVGNSLGQILKLDSTYDNSGSPIYSYIETGDLDMSSKFKDMSLWDKLTDSLYPVFKPQDKDTPVIVQIGSRADLSHPIKWSKPTSYIIGISKKVDPRSNGKWIRIRFYTNQLEDKWTLESYKLLYTVRGQR